MEEWRPIKGYEGYYEVSNLGRVRSLDRYVTHSRNPAFKSLRKGVIKTLGDNGNGYKIASCSKQGKHTRRSEKVHRLVAAAFIPNPECKKQVNHKNGIKSDNRVENLEWCTSRENVRHAIETGLITKRVSTKPPYVRKRFFRRPILMYTMDGVFIRRFESGAEAFRVGGYQPFNVLHGINKHCKGYIFKFEEGTQIT